MDELNIEQADGGLIFPIKVKPRSSRNAVIGVRSQALHIAVTAVPEKGKANQVVVQLLSTTLKIPKSSIEIIADQTSRNKRVRITDLSESDLKARLTA